MLKNPRIKKILHLSIPAAVNNFLDIVQLLIDMIMIGRLGASAIAGVGISLQFVGLIYTLLSTFHVGTNALVSRFVGAGNKEDAGKVIFNMMIMAFIFSIPIMLIGIFYSKNLLLLMGTDEEVASIGGRYLSIISFTIPLLFMEGVFYSSLNASGDTKTPLKIGITSNLINTFMNYVLIFGHFGFPAFGVEGAAYATVIAYISEFFIYLYVFLRKNASIKIFPEYSKDLIKRALRVGIPSGIERLITYSSFLIFVKIIADYGTYTLAGYQIGLRIEGLAFMPGIGFTIAAMALVGQSIGRGDYKEAEQNAITTVKIAAIFMGILGIFMVLIPEYLCIIFTDNPKVIEEASLYLRIVGVSQVPLGVAFVLSGALRGAGATRITLTVNALALWFLRIVPAYILSVLFHNIIFVYFIMVFETFTRSFILWYIFKKGKWKNIEV